MGGGFVMQWEGRIICGKVISHDCQGQPGLGGVSKDTRGLYTAECVGRDIAISTLGLDAKGIVVGFLSPIGICKN